MVSRQLFSEEENLKDNRTGVIRGNGTNGNIHLHLFAIYLLFIYL